MDAMPIELSTIDRKHVITKDGRRIGEMIGCKINTSEWKVIDLLIEDMTIKKRMFRKPQITIRTDMIGVVGDVIQLNLDYDTLKSHL
jgi:sporulation protein YlmC with PRC-barrel domain